MSLWIYIGQIIGTADDLFLIFLAFIAFRVAQRRRNKYVKYLIVSAFLASFLVFNEIAYFLAHDSIHYRLDILILAFLLIYAFIHFGNVLIQKLSKRSNQPG